MSFLFFFSFLLSLFVLCRTFFSWILEKDVQVFAMIIKWNMGSYWWREKPPTEEMKIENESEWNRTERNDDDDDEKKNPFSATNTKS